MCCGSTWLVTTTAATMLTAAITHWTQKTVRVRSSE